MALQNGVAGCATESLVWVASWFVANITIGTLMKWLLLYGNLCITGEDCQAYNFPLTISAVHQLIGQAMCYIYLRKTGQASRITQLCGMQRLRKVGPLAACFAISVGMGNLSLNYIYPSFKQMVGAGSPLVTVVMAVVFTGTKYNRWTWVSMPLICGGLCCCAQEEVYFSIFGTVYAVLAMVTRSAKSIVQAKLLGKQERLDPVLLLYYKSPYAAFLMMAIALPAEGVQPITLLVRGFMDLGNGNGAEFLRLVLLLLLSGFNACALNLCGFHVTRCTSAVTFQVLGSVKSCVGIAVSVAILGNPLKLIQVAGMIVCLFGVWIYETYGGISVDQSLSYRDGVGRV